MSVRELIAPAVKVLLVLYERDCRLCCTVNPAILLSWNWITVLLKSVLKP